jgi:hypothetical protein
MQAHADSGTADASHVCQNNLFTWIDFLKIILVDSERRRLIFGLLRTRITLSM